MKEKVKAAIEKVRPMLQADGGDVELVDVEDGVVKVRLQGGCRPDCFHGSLRHLYHYGYQVIS